MNETRDPFLSGSVGRKKKKKERKTARHKAATGKKGKNKLEKERQSLCRGEGEGGGEKFFCR